MTDWCYRFTFSISDESGWEQLYRGVLAPYGWQSECNQSPSWFHDPNFYEGVDIKLQLQAPITLTEFKMQFEYEPGNNAQAVQCYLALNHEGAGSGQRVATTNYGLSPLVWTGEESVSYLEAGAYAGYGSSCPHGNAVIKRITLSGTGENPFACIFEGHDTDFYRAPITNNPLEPDNNLQYSNTYSFLVNARFVDYLQKVWYRVFSIEQVGTPCVNVDPRIDAAIAAGKGGVWIPAPSADSIGGLDPATLPIDHRYDIPTVPWTGFSGQFAGWQIGIADMCASETTPREIRALGIGGEGVGYPRNTHNGVDFFVPNSQTDVVAKSIDNGIVVGIGRGTDNEKTHAPWGATDLDDNAVGWCVIVRYGHLYVLYGHLSSIEDGVWVGGSLETGTRIGILGKSNNRHSHIEVHSYGATITDGIGATKAELIGSTGILPLGESASDIVAPFHYDITQFLTDPPGYSTTDNGSLHLRDRVATSQLTQNGSEGSVSINFGASCIFTYRTIYPNISDPSAIIKETDSYRGFVGYSTSPDRPLNRPLVSPLTQTQQP